MWLCERQARPHRLWGSPRGQRRKTRRGRTACSWALVSAQTSSPCLRSSGQGGSGGACSGPDWWEGRQRVEGSFGFLSLAAARHPGEQSVQLWRTVVAWGLGHSLSPTVSPHILPLLVLGHCSLWPRHRHPAPLRDTGKERAPG